MSYPAIWRVFRADPPYRWDSVGSLPADFVRRPFHGRAGALGQLADDRRAIRPIYGKHPYFRRLSEGLFRTRRSSSFEIRKAHVTLDSVIRYCADKRWDSFGTSV